MSSLPNDAPSPRLCIIVKWPDFEGYGFNLHADKSRPGQYIGKVDENSPAEAAGLREDDRIIEVNGANIANENHKQVVQRIKAVANETRLLVVDPQTDKYYKSKNIVVRGTQENVIVRSSARDQKRSATPEPQSQPAAAVSNGHHEEADNRSVSSAASSSATSEVSTQPQHAAATDEPDKDKDATLEEASAQPPMENEKSRSPSPPPVEEAMKPSDEAAEPQEDRGSETDSDKVSEKDEKVVFEESVPEVTVISHAEEPEKYEQAPSEGDTPAQEEAHEEVKEEKVEEEEKSTEAAAPPAAEQESDLEAEYDNVEIDAGRATGAATQVASSDSRRLSASSGDSHSSHGSDTARTTDPHTQSPMSTSPTPPPSLEPAPAPAPEPVRNTPSPKSSTTTTTSTATSNTTNNASPKPVSNNNAYNSSGLNLNMSAAEMRAKLASKKKADPRKDTVDLKKKYEIIQNM